MATVSCEPKAEALEAMKKPDECPGNETSTAPNGKLFTLEIYFLNIICKYLKNHTIGQALWYAKFISP